MLMVVLQHIVWEREKRQLQEQSLWIFGEDRIKCTNGLAFSRGLIKMCWIKKQWWIMDSFLKAIKSKDGRQTREALARVQTMPCALLLHKSARILRKPQHISLVRLPRADGICWIFKDEKVKRRILRERKRVTPAWGDNMNKNRERWICTIAS